MGPERDPIGGPVVTDSYGRTATPNTQRNRTYLKRSPGRRGSIDPRTRTIITVADDGKAGYSGDNGPAADAELHAPDGLAFDSAGDLIIADSGNYRIREIVSATGDIITMAGNGTVGYREV